MEIMGMWTFCSETLWLCARVFYLALPVLFAAALHMVVLRRDLFAGLKVPIDLGCSMRGRRILGDHKTWRGALVMIAGPSLGMIVQGYLRVPRLELFDYGEVNVGLCGAFLGLGFVLAELPNSFLKRFCGVSPGCQAEGSGYWFFTLLDQVDSVVGCLLALALVWQPPWIVITTALLLGCLFHVGFNLVFVLLGLKERAL
jgi:hypothetical protein